MVVMSVLLSIQSRARLGVLGSDRILRDGRSAKGIRDAERAGGQPEARRSCAFVQITPMDPRLGIT